MMPCEDGWHVPSDIKIDHLFSVISKGLAHVAGEIENFASFLNEVNVN